MREGYVTVRGESIFECTIKGSRFIAVSGPCSSESDLDSAMADIKVRYPNATHYCYAAIFNGNDRFSDNGEPSGTAGRPILQVLKGSDIDDLFCIVVRYFGGTLLGTGGLVQAYSDSSSKSVGSLERVRMVISKRVSFSLSYTEYNRFMSECTGLILGRPEQEFAESVTITAFLPEDNEEEFGRRLADITRGAAKVIVLSESYQPLN